MGTRSNRLSEAVITSTHNVCFGAKIRKVGIPLHTMKVGYKGLNITRKCYPDVFFFLIVALLCSYMSMLLLVTQKLR